MKILFLVTDDWYFLSHRLPLARGMRDAGFEVVVITAPGDRVREIEAEGFRHRPLVFRRRVLSQLANLPLIERLTRIYREERPDIAHHVSFLPLFYGSMAARRARVPAVVNAVTGLGHAFIDGPRGRRPLRWGVEHAYRMALSIPNATALFQNEDDRQYFIARGLVDSDRCLCVAGSGVDVERFVPRAAPKNDGPPIVLHASRMLWSKGVEDSVEASRILTRRDVPHRLILAGRTHPTNPGSIPESSLRAWGEEGAAEWIGECADMPELLNSARVVCLPTVYREGVPKVLLEAAACGRPIVATDVPGCRDVVTHGENGLKVEARDPRGLADALERLLTDPELCSRMGQSGRAKIVEGFSNEIVVERTLARYRVLLGDRWPCNGTGRSAGDVERSPIGDVPGALPADSEVEAQRPKP